MMLSGLQVTVYRAGVALGRTTLKCCFPVDVGCVLFAFFSNNSIFLILSFLFSLKSMLFYLSIRTVEYLCRITANLDR